MKHFQLIGALATAVSLVTTAALSQDEPNHSLFTNVNVFDGVSPELMMDANDLFDGHLIAAVSAQPLD